MSKKYKKGDKIYEEGGFFQEDKEVGRIKKSATGDWIETPSGGYGGKYESNLRGDEHTVTTDSGLSKDKGYVIKEKEFGKGSSYSEFPAKETKSHKKYRSSNYSSTSMIDSVDDDAIFPVIGCSIYLIAALVFLVSYTILSNDKDAFVSGLVGFLFWPVFLISGKIGGQQSIYFSSSFNALISAGIAIAIIVIFFLYIIVSSIIDGFRRR